MENGEAKISKIQDSHTCGLEGSLPRDSVHSTVFSVLAMVHRQRLALLHIQSSSPNVADNIAEGISRVNHVAGSLGLFSKPPEQSHLRQ